MNAAQNADDAIQMTQSKRTTCHTFRHWFATRALEDGYNIGTVQELPGRKDVKTTMIDSHIPDRDGKGVWTICREETRISYIETIYPSRSL
uniref:Phage integrase family protein n=1 Tax=Candidatus Kentrum sp. MB TaxID=2138164 RepID=A0A450X2U3_9GAMM|nr:MAG: Phage integrase family protein [Candidatus Kentron sp. MB]VFK27984.1 MAG: Phage integrase family protein [Candidatus Kentron sp. MB]